MFFHQFKRSTDVAKGVSESKAAIIFLVDPSSEDGIALLDSNFCSPLGEYGERKNLDLLYTSESSVAEYPRFVASLFQLLAEHTDQLPKDPAIIIIWRENSETRIDIISDYEVNDKRILRKDIYALMDALCSSESEKSLYIWQTRRKLRSLSVTHGSTVEKILGFLKKYLGPLLPAAFG